jgi:hypothetical protein
LPPSGVENKIPSSAKALKLLKDKKKARSIGAAGFSF